MSFSVLVPVNVDNLSFNEENVRTTIANDTISTTLLAGVSHHDTADDVSAKIEQNYHASTHNAFAVAVDHAVRKAMHPYSRTCKDPEFLSFVDVTESLKERFEKETVNCIAYGETLYLAHELSGFRVCQDGVVREVAPNGCEFLSEKARAMRAVTVPAKEFYKTFKNYADSHYQYHHEQDAWGYFVAKLGFFVNYYIGGSTKAILLVKDTCEECTIFAPDHSNDELPKPPVGYKWTSAARIKDIEFDVMNKRVIDDKGHHPHISEFLCGYLDTSIIPDVNNEDEYAYYTKDEEAYDGSWEDAVNAFIETLDPNMVLAIVNCI
jgi:hypothetical protein